MNAVKRTRTVSRESARTSRHHQPEADTALRLRRKLSPTRVKIMLFSCEKFRQHKVTSAGFPTDVELNATAVGSKKQVDELLGEPNYQAAHHLLVREPVRFHHLQQFFRHREVWRGGDDGVYAALGAHSCGSAVRPFLDLGRRVDCQAVEAAAHRSFAELLAVLCAPRVSRFLVELLHVVPLVSPSTTAGATERKPFSSARSHTIRHERFTPGANRPWWHA